MQKDDVLWVSSGDIEHGSWTLTGDIIERLRKSISLKTMIACTVVSDRHETTHSGSGRIAGGILGAALLGPIGAAAGLMTGGKTRIDKTIVLCSFSDGKSFSAEVSQLTAAKLGQIAQRNAERLASVCHPPRSNHTTVGAGDVIDCPMCAETIKAKAKICRFCGHDLHAEPNSDLIETRTATVRTPSSNTNIDKSKLLQSQEFNDWCKNSLAFNEDDDEEKPEVIRLYAGMMEVFRSIEKQGITVDQEWKNQLSYELYSDKNEIDYADFTDPDGRYIDADDYTVDEWLEKRYEELIRDSPVIQVNVTEPKVDIELLIKAFQKGFESKS